MSISTAKTRLTLELSDVLNKKLETIASEEGLTKTDILRKAIAFFDVAHQAAKEGKQISVTRDEKILKEIVGV